MRTRDVVNGISLALSCALIAGAAAAACISPPLSPEFVNQFKSNPGQLIANPDTDAHSVEATARNLAGTDPALATSLVQLADAALPRFRTAIAAGLAQAALACTSVDQQAALQIQQSVASAPDGDFQSLFADLAGDLSTAAGAASAAADSSGSVPIIHPNGSHAAKTSPGGGTVTTGLSNSAFAVASPRSSNGVPMRTDGVTAANSVSATR